MKAYKSLLRRVGYYALRPHPPRYSSLFRNPVLIVGSAPVSHLPDGYQPNYHLLTINGSQSVTTGWGLADPDVTFLQYRQVYGSNDNAVAVRKALKDQSTGHLYVMRWTQSRKELEDGLAAFNYSYGHLHIVNRLQRMALFKSIMGYLNTEDDLETRFSNGVTAVLYALASGARAVIITGINPASQGHIYNNLNLGRQHSQTDHDVLVALLRAGHPVYTADPDVAQLTGLPLWKADSWTLGS